MVGDVSKYAVGKCHQMVISTTQVHIILPQTPFNWYEITDTN